MLCAKFLRAVPATARRGWLDRHFEAIFDAVLAWYARTLGWALRRRRLMVLVTIAVIALTVWLYGVVPKGFLPTEDTGLIQGNTIASPDVSFGAMKQRRTRFWTCCEPIRRSPRFRRRSAAPAASSRR